MAEALQRVGAELLVDYTTATLVGVAVTTLVIYWWISTPKNMPPGPMGLPIIGSLITFISAVSKNRGPYLLDEWSKVYGKIVSVKLGVSNMIYISDGDIVKELFDREDCNSRPVNLTVIKMLLGDGVPEDGAGLILHQGAGHREMRRFALLTLRDLGVGKATLDEQIQIEAEAFIEYLSSIASDKGGVETDLKPKVQKVIANVIHNIVFGYRYDYDNRKFHQILERLENFFSTNAFAMPENFLPFIKYIPFINSKARLFAAFFQAQDSVVEYTAEQITEHRKTFNKGEIRDFVDLYLENEEETRDHFTKTNLYYVILDLFRAGTDTTANTMTWSVLYLMKYPDVQAELQAEIDEHIGDQPFKRADKERLTKVKAFINEVLRIASIAYQGVPHVSTTDVEVSGYTIPANSIIVPIIWSIHHDEKYWKDPEEFRLDRWYNKETGEEITHGNHFIPFSVGRRACLGKQLAFIELMVFLVSVLQRFSFTSVCPTEQLDTSANFGIVSQPKPYQFKVTKRS